MSSAKLDFKMKIVIKEARFEEFRLMLRQVGLLITSAVKINEDEIELTLVIADEKKGLVPVEPVEQVES